MKIKNEADIKMMDENCIQSVRSPAEHTYNNTAFVDDNNSVTTAVINTNIRPSDIVHYINSEFHSKVDKKPVQFNDTPAHRMDKSANTKHPQTWSKDKNGRFTYTGSFSSEC